MLTELRISNFGVIEQLDIEFHDGFTVLTGETGAGKSLLIDALTLLIGGRASAEQIRAGSTESHLQAIFSLNPDHSLLHELQQTDIVAAGVTDLIVHRVLARSGRNRNYINTVAVPLHLLERLGGTLVDIHGQHDQQSLLSTDRQLDALDAYGQLRALRGDYTAAYGVWKQRRELFEQLRSQIEERRQREDYLRFQYKEIRDAALESDEDIGLGVERRKLAGAQQVRELTQRAYDLLYGGDEAVLNGLAAVDKVVRQLEALDVGTETWSSLSAAASVQLRELASLVREYRESLEDDPERLARVEHRLDILDRIKSKYGGSIAAVLKRAESVEQELSLLDTAETRLGEYKRESLDAGKRVMELAAKLSRKRVEVAKRFDEQVRRELSALMMERTRFEVLLEPKTEEHCGPTGQDRISFHLSANPGEPLHPLAQAASGGELSRIMLALKTILAETDRVPILVFDEIDSGVGGAVAEVMGKRLRSLGTHHQVFCVTHLPQVASQAHRHCLVTKQVKQKRTVTQVRELLPEEREEEIARMLGGLTVTKNVRATAAEMIRGAGGRQAESEKR